MKTVFFGLLTLFSLTIAKAQTADEIIAKHAEALGGKDKIAQVNSVYKESTTEAMGTQASSKTYIVNGKGYRTESDFGGQGFVQVVTDTGGWVINPFAGAPDPTAISDHEFQTGADQVFAVVPLLNYTVNGGKVELVGQEKVDDINAYKIKYTNKYNVESFYYIDSATSQIIQSVQKGNSMGQEITVTVAYSDYKQTDYGIFMPYKTRVDMGQFALDITTEKVEIK